MRRLCSTPMMVPPAARWVVPMFCVSDSVYFWFVSTSVCVICVVKHSYFVCVIQFVLFGGKDSGVYTLKFSSSIGTETGEKFKKKKTVFVSR